MEQNAIDKTPQWSILGSRCIPHGRDEEREHERQGRDVLHLSGIYLLLGPKSSESCFTTPV